MSDSEINRSDVDRRDALRQAAMLAGDSETLSSVLHEDLSFVHSAGQWEDKSRHVDALASRRVKYLKWHQTDLRSVWLGAGGWLKNGRAEIIVEFGGNRIELDLVFSAAWILDGEWKLISWQSTPWAK